MSNVVETKMRVRFAECDYYGHVNNAEYIVFLDVGIGDFLRQICPDLRDLKFLIHKVHASIDYLDAAEFEDELVVKTSIFSTGNTSITFYHEIMKGEKAIVKAKIIFALLDVKTGEKCLVPDELRALK